MLAILGAFILLGFVWGGSKACLVIAAALIFLGFKGGRDAV